MTKQVMKPRRKAKLPQSPPMELRRKRTLIVVANGARARFFEPRHAARTLVPASQDDLVAPGSRLQNQEITADRPGRGFASAGSTQRHAFEPPHDPQKLEKHDFMATLARTLEAICGDYDRLVLVAPSRSLGELNGLLSPQADKMVSHRIAKDLTMSSPADLWQALDKVVPPPVLS